MTGVAVVAAMISVWLLMPVSGPGLKRLVPKARRAGRTVTGWQICSIGCVITLVSGVFAKPLAIIAAIGVVTVTATWVVAARVSHKRSLRRTVEVVQAARTIESLLALGHVPAVALSLAAQDCPILDPVVAAVPVGIQPWEIMEDLAAVPGQSGLGDIGRAWKVSQATGASIRDSLETVRAGLEQAADTAGIIAGELAGPRATGQILALLPFLGLGLAAGMGAHPLHFLTAGLIGRSCLMAGIGLACSGVVWSEIVARRASGVPAVRWPGRIRGRPPGKRDSDE